MTTERELLQQALDSLTECKAPQDGAYQVDVAINARRYSTMAKIRAHLAAPPARSDLIPGKMRCAKCDFSLIRTTLNVTSGTAYAGGSETEPCPNGCGPLWPITWEQEARDGYKIMDSLFERAKKAEDALVAPPVTVEQFHHIPASPDATDTGGQE